MRPTPVSDLIRRPCPERCWTKPQTNWIKVSTDAALNSKSNKASWGIVARNWYGKLIGTWAIPTTSCSSAQQEEAMAIRRSKMVIARQMGWRNAVFESDCKQVVDKLNTNEEEASIATILLDIRKLKEDFDECCFSFTKRRNNSVSHHVAKFAISLIDIAQWKYDFPIWLLELVQADSVEQLL
ncbi:uncharacterized protein [Coffea arabica]|uniref:RNase H type-1 domain-containing protein n=1 Tax=Coffea arabica TaxID=13443 RepID=A0ABM4X617_COFAR